MLIVEDNTADVFLIREAIQLAKIPVTVHVVTDGEQAIRFFDAADRDSTFPCPTLVILDINLPKKQGGEVLKYMRKSHRCREALVLAVSSSDFIQDRQEMQQLGADGYFKKPSEYDDFMKLAGIVQVLLRRKPQQ